MSPSSQHEELTTLKVQTANEAWYFIGIRGFPAYKHAASFTGQ